MFDKDTDEASSNPDRTAMDILRGKEEGEQRKAEYLNVCSPALYSPESGRPRGHTLAAAELS